MFLCGRLRPFENTLRSADWITRNCCSTIQPVFRYRERDSRVFWDNLPSVIRSNFLLPLKAFEMGSSKKHKDKDRERDKEHKRKRRHRSRSRSRSPSSRDKHKRSRKEKEDSYTRSRDVESKHEEVVPEFKQERDQGSHSAGKFFGFFFLKQLLNLDVPARVISHDRVFIHT